MGRLRLLEFHCRFRFWNPRRLDHEQRPGAHIEMLNSKVLLAGLLGAISWNLITLTLGSPTSSSHALMGGYGGAAVALPGFLTLIMSGWKLPVLSIFCRP